MTKTAHTLSVIVMAAIVLITFTLFLFYGISYYRTPIGERVRHQNHELLKPSGDIAHGAGIFGSLFMIVGIASYMARKRFRFMSRMGLLKYWLEFHIFLCTLGPVMILFHTAFKFGGIVAVSFWCMVAVFLSGIIGRFIYLQIPRSIEGRELNLNEIRDSRRDIAEVIKITYDLDAESYNTVISSVRKKTMLYQSNPLLRYIKWKRHENRAIRTVRQVLSKNKLTTENKSKIIRLVKDDLKTNRRIELLDTMQNLFKYWHVVHLPFAMVMLIIMVVHISITVLFGYHWVF